MSTGISVRNLPLYPRGDSFPHSHGYIRGKSSPVPARQLFSALPRVYSREFFPCTRAVTLFRISTGISAGFLPLYPRGVSFPLGHGYIRGNPFPVPAWWLFSALPRVYPRVIFSCTRASALFRVSTGIFAGNLLLYPRGASFPRFHGYIRGKSSPVPARCFFSALPRVYPREIFPCTRAVALFLASTGISAGNLLLYPRGSAFPRGHGYIRGYPSPVPDGRVLAGGYLSIRCVSGSTGVSPLSSSK